MPVAIVISALLIVGAVVGIIFSGPAGAVLGLPLVFLFIGLILGREAMMRQRRILQMKRFRREAQARKSDFDAQDKRTLV